MQDLGSGFGGANVPKAEPFAKPLRSPRRPVPAGAVIIDLDDEEESAGHGITQIEESGQNMDVEPMQQNEVSGTQANGKRAGDADVIRNADVTQQPASKKRKGLAPERPPPRKTLEYTENLATRRDWKKRREEPPAVPRIEIEQRAGGRAQVVSSEGSPSPAVSAALDTPLQREGARGAGPPAVSAQSGDSRVCKLDVTPPMRAGVNVSAFYPTLERVLTEYADNSIAAILRMLAGSGAIAWGNLWVKYEGATLEIRDDGPGMTLDQFKRAIKLSGTGRSQRTKEQIRQQVQSEKPHIGRNSTSAASGQYGYGLFAGFAVAEEITITTTAEGASRLTCHLKKEIWDSMDTSWQVPYDESGARDESHGTQIVLRLTKDYHYSREHSEQLRAALCAVCAPFADIENGLPTQLPPLFQGGRLGKEKLLDKTLGDKFRVSKKQPVVVSFNLTQLFAEREARMANLEAALGMVPENPGLVRIPLTALLEQTAMVCIGSINTVLGRPAIANYATLYPEMFQVVWQHRGGISGYTPKNLRALAGKERLRGIIFLGEHYRPMPPKDKIAADCPMWQMLTKTVDEFLRKNLEDLLNYFQQFDSSVLFEELEREEEDGTKYFRKATITTNGSTSELRLNSVLRCSGPAGNMVSLCALREDPGGTRAAQVSLLTCRGVRDEMYDLSVEELVDSQAVKKKGVETYRRTLPSEATCEVVGKPDGPEGQVRLRVGLKSAHPEKIHLPEDIAADVLCNGKKIARITFENESESLHLPVPKRAGPAQFSVRIAGWDIKSNNRCEKARVVVPPGPAVAPLLTVKPEKVVRSGEPLTLRVSFKDKTGEDQAKLPRGVEVTATVKGKKSTRGGENPPVVTLEGLKIDQKERRVAVVEAMIEGPAQSVTLTVNIKWKGETEDPERKVKLNLELTAGRPTRLAVVAPTDLVVENGGEIGGLVFGLSDGFNALEDAPEVTLTSDDVSFEGQPRGKVRRRGSVRVSCIEGRGEEKENGVRECKATAVYKEKGKNGQELSVNFTLQVLPGKVPKRLGFELPAEDAQGLRIPSGGRVFAEGALKAFVLGETGDRLSMKAADVFSLRWKHSRRRGASFEQQLPPPVKAKEFSTADAAEALFPEVMAPDGVGQYELLLDLDDRLSEPRLQMSETVASNIVVVAGAPVKIKTHGGPTKNQQFDAKRCVLIGSLTVTVADAADNKCEELESEIPVRILLAPSTENPDIKPPTLEVLPRDPPKGQSPAPIELSDLRLMPFDARLELLDKIKVNQDGSTGFYDLRVEADGLEPFASPIYYINDSELSAAAEEERTLQERLRTIGESVTEVQMEVYEIKKKEDERRKNVSMLTAQMAEHKLAVQRAERAFSQFGERIHTDFGDLLPPDIPLTPDSIDAVGARIEDRSLAEQSTLQGPYLGDVSNASSHASLVRRVRTLASNLRAQGVLGVLGDLAQANEPRVCRALASLVLGPQKLCWVIVRNQEAKAACVRFLRSAGNAVSDIPFMPLDGFVRPHNPGMNPRFEGCIGYAANLIRLPANLPPDLKKDLEAVVRNACRDTLLFETGAAALEFKRFFLAKGKTGGIPRMVSLDGHRLESNGVEFEGGEETRMPYSLGQCHSASLERLHCVRHALVELKDCRQRYSRALTAQQAWEAPGGDAERITLEIAMLEQEGLERRAQATALGMRLKELSQEQSSVTAELKRVQASMQKTPVSLPTPTKKTSATKRGGRKG